MYSECVGKSKTKTADQKLARVAKLPKKKCCVSSTKCTRCPLRMLKEGTLPAGYTVKKRKLVKVDLKPAAQKAAPKTAPKTGQKTVKTGKTAA